MQLSWIAQGAVTSERNRRRAMRTGTSFSGAPLWTEEEVADLRALYPTKTYVEMAKLIPGRSWYAIRHKCQKLGLTTKRHVWTGAEIGRLRRVYRDGTAEDIRAAFPAFSKKHIAQIACNHGILRARQPFKQTGIQAIDRIRERAFELGYSMPDIDKLARSRKYFQQGTWHAGHIDYRAIARAINALDGVVSADWR